LLTQTVEDASSSLPVFNGGCENFESAHQRLFRLSALSFLQLFRLLFSHRLQSPSSTTYPKPIMTMMLTVFAAVAAVTAALPAPQDDPGHCFPLDPGYGPVPTDNTPSGFLGFKDLSTAATSALTPQGFIKSSEDRSYTYSDASLYAGYQELQTYDPQTCK
jgi:hypothetical protein